jgi:ADP-heptose:LPS heptosyltransferase
VNLGLAKVVDRLVGGLAGRLIAAGDQLRALGRTPPPVASVGHLLVVKFWGLGNWALLRPVVRDLQARWPGAKTTIATLAVNRPLVEDLADDVLTVHPRGYARVTADLVRAVGTLRRRPPDLAVDFEQFATAGALLARAGNAAQRVGFATEGGRRDGLYTVVVPFRRDVHVTRSFRDLAEAAGVERAPYTPGGLPVSDAGRREAQAWTRGGPFVVLHPGSGDNFPGRRWSATGFAAVARAASSAGHRVVVTGTEGEREIAAEVVRRAGNAAVSAAGALGVEGLLALLDEARVLVSNDTGPVHLASALGTPVFAVFGPNTPVLYAPLAPESRSFYRALPCSPCLTTTNYRSSRCRIHTCIESIPVGEVAGALVRLLAGTAVRGGTS